MINKKIITLLIFISAFNMQIINAMNHIMNHEQKIAELIINIDKNKAKLENYNKQLTENRNHINKIRAADYTAEIEKSLTKNIAITINKLTEEITKLEKQNSNYEQDIIILNDINKLIKKETEQIENEKKEKTLLKTLENAGNKNDKKLVQLFIDWNLSPDYKFSDGSHIISKAINYGKFELFKYLVDNSANVNIKDKFGDTLLHEAVTSLSINENNEKIIEIIKILVDKVANLNVQNNLGQTPLHLTALISHHLPNSKLMTQAANILVEKGSDPLIKDNNEDMPKDIVNVELKESKAFEPFRKKPFKLKDGIKLEKYFKNNGDKYEQKFIELMDKLELSANCKLCRDKFITNNTKPDTYDFILSLAIETGKIKLFNSLIEKGANVNLENNSQETPLHFAAKFYENDPKEIGKKLKMIKTLIEKGANINAKDINGNRPVDLQVINQASKIYKYLQEITEKSLLNIIKKNTTVYVNTPVNDNVILKEILFYACWHGNAKILNELINLGIDVNIKNSSGQTPLHVAINGRKNVKDLLDEEDRYDYTIKLLLEKAKANPQLEDANGKKAIDVPKRGSITHKIIKTNDLNNYFEKISNK